MDSSLCKMQLQIVRVVISSFIIKDEMQSLQESTMAILSFFERLYRISQQWSLLNPVWYLYCEHIVQSHHNMCHFGGCSSLQAMPYTTWMQVADEEGWPHKACDMPYLLATTSVSLVILRIHLRQTFLKSKPDLLEFFEQALT